MAEDILGSWAIFEVNYEGQTTEVPVDYESCGRDFFQFLNNEIYKEYAIASGYQFEHSINSLSWELNQEGASSFK